MKTWQQDLVTRIRYRKKEQFFWEFAIETRKIISETVEKKIKHFDSENH